MNISFFARPTFTVEQEGVGSCLQRISSVIRGKEIASYLGGKYNPKERDGVCIYVKPQVIDTIRDGDYVDVLDNIKLTYRLKERPKIKVIAMSKSHFHWLKTIIKNEVILIPHHHLNFERVRRSRNKVVTCGYIGTYRPYHVKINQELRKKLNKVGLDLLEFYKLSGNRQDVVDFYKQIDIQVIGYFRHIRGVPYYHPAKIVNAMSFGIPTISGQRVGYSEVEGLYRKVKDIDEIVSEAVRLRNHLEFYNYFSNTIIAESEKYHIDNIAKLYKQLCK